jgi:hypothetical protein
MPQSAVGSGHEAELCDDRQAQAKRRRRTICHYLYHAVPATKSLVVLPLGPYSDAVVRCRTRRHLQNSRHRVSVLGVFDRSAMGDFSLSI